MVAASRTEPAIANLHSADRARGARQAPAVLRFDAPAKSEGEDTDRDGNRGSLTNKVFCLRHGASFHFVAPHSEVRCSPTLDLNIALVKT